MDQEDKLESGKLVGEQGDQLKADKLSPPLLSQSTGNIFQKLNQGENIYRSIYSDTNRRWTGILALLFRWKKSVYSLIWNHVITFFVAYFFLAFFYRFGLWHYPAYKQTFEILCIYADSFTKSMPVTFLIGFYVTQIVNRWWAQFMTLPYPDDLALKLVAFIPGRVSKIYPY